MAKMQITTTLLHRGSAEEPTPSPQLDGPSGREKVRGGGGGIWAGVVEMPDSDKYIFLWGVQSFLTDFWFKKSLRML